ncbi:MAG: sialidase family protein [Chitinophagaceae bacterium]
MKKVLFVLAICTVSTGLCAQQKSIPVFVSGTEGHKSYRIPAVIGLPNGKLLVFSEGRVNGAGDFGDINIVMKTSTDNGKTWTALMTIIDADSLQAGNPAPVVDLTDPLYPQGRIFLFYNTGNNHEAEVRKGKGLREVWYKTSADGGATWSEAVNITLQVHKPRQPWVNAAYNFPEDWRSYANTPGHAMQFSNGKYKGRIFVAANHSAGEPQADFTDYRAHCFYTGDHGKTFSLGGTINIPGGNENMAVALSNDKLMINFRNQQGNIKSRVVAISSTGGQSWDTTYFDTQLPDPVCQGSILDVSSNNEKRILAFCNAADTSRRNNLTLRISYDEGKTWPKKYLIDAAPENSQGDYTAYSDLVGLNKNEIGIVYEKDNYKAIVFTVVNWKQ